jgi:WD40 repeat protein
VSRKLQFHTKGLQGLAFSSDGSYLISIGNHKENTLAVWDWHAGKLITSTYTINILNDVKCQKDNKIFADYMLQFCTGGNDVVSLWRVKEDCMLESDDIKIDQVFSAEIQITAVEYFYPTNTAVMVLVGM